MKEHRFVPLIEAQLDPEVERRMSVTILALTHGTRAVHLAPDFPSRDDHLARAQDEVRRHHARYRQSGLCASLPVVGYRYFPAPGWGFALGLDGELRDVFRGRPIQAGFCTAGGEEIALTLPEEP
ncbi:hypothetical protein [Oceanithermus sp.]|uniref:hypothetical protein n=1 Tax=Oceanithermus sp. TaxID=2268145 RepID=UPI0025CD87F0|nr:hypothetical protein [Oceanithermus sp.]